MRVLMVAPHAPRVHKGGAEVAALRLTEGLRAEGVDAWHLSAAPRAMVSSDPFSAIADRQYVVPEDYSDMLRYTSSRSAWTNRTFARWLHTTAPDAVHMHHFLGIGSDFIGLVRNALPGVPVVYTAHEFLLMCARDGKMMTRHGGFCDGPSPGICSDCVGAHPVDLFFRDDYFRAFLNQVDSLIAPSQFVAERLADWAGRVEVNVIPNLLP